MNNFFNLIAGMSLVAMAQLASANTITHGVGGTYTVSNGSNVVGSTDFDRAEFTFASEYVDTITIANTGSGFAHDHGNGALSDLQVYNGINWITVLSTASGNNTTLSKMFSMPVMFSGMNITGMRLDSSIPVGYMYHFINSGMTYTLTTTNNVPEPTSIALMGLGIVGMAALRRRRKAA